MMRMVYLSPVPWSSFSQRPHKFVEWFHDRFDGSVLWVDPYPSRLPSLHDFRRLVEIKSNRIREHDSDWLQIESPRAFPVEPIPVISLINHIFFRRVSKMIAEFISDGHCVVFIGKPSDLSLMVLRDHPEIFSIYDVMDNLPAFFNGLSRNSMKKREDMLIDLVSSISASSTMLFGQFSEYKQEPILALNAFDPNVLPSGNQCINTSGRIVIGYVGMISHWFDWSLVISIAESNPEAIVRLIGPVRSRVPRNLPGNIERYPECDHVTALKLMCSFSVAIIPFMKNELTAYVDPIKYYEYKALGLPIITTDFGEMALRKGEPGVYFVDDYEDMSELINEASCHVYTESEIASFRQKNSWDVRFDSAYSSLLEGLFT